MATLESSQPSLLPGYVVNIRDGNALAATETAFQVLATALTSEIDTLAYPPYSASRWRW